MVEDVRVTNTAGLRLVAEAGRELGYNRQIPAEVIDQLDEDGLHLIVPLMIHSHAGGEKVEPHLRCRAFVKGPESDAPITGIIDIPVIAFSKMVPVGELIDVSEALETILNPPENLL